VQIAEIINRETRKFPGQELEAKLLAADVACGTVRNIGEIIQEPHVQARGILEEVNYPSLGNIVAVKTPIFFSGKPAPFRRRAPMLGEHSREILKELGYTDEQVQDLIQGGVAVQFESK
jgi:formyl-CoA transferase